MSIALHQAVKIGAAALSIVSVNQLHADPQPAGHVDLSHEIIAQNASERVEAEVSADAALAATPHNSESSTPQSNVIPRQLPPPSRLAPKETSDTAGPSLSFDAGWIRTLSALGVILVILLGLRALVRRSGMTLAGGRAPSGVLEVLGRFPFARGQSLVLLKLDRRILLLCQTATGATTLAQIDDPNEVAAVLQRTQDESGVSFNRRLEELLSGGGRDQLFGRRLARPRNDAPVFGDAEVIDLTARSRPSGAGRRSAGAGA